MKVNEVIVEGFWDDVKTMVGKGPKRVEPAWKTAAPAPTKKRREELPPIEWDGSVDYDGSTDPSAPIEYTPAAAPAEPVATTEPAATTAAPAAFKYGDPITVGKGQKPLKSGDPSYDAIAKQMLAQPATPAPAAPAAPAPSYNTGVQAKGTTNTFRPPATARRRELATAESAGGVPWSIKK